MAKSNLVSRASSSARSAAAWSLKVMGYVVSLLMVVAGVAVILNTAGVASKSNVVRQLAQRAEAIAGKAGGEGHNTVNYVVGGVLVLVGLMYMGAIAVH